MGWGTGHTQEDSLQEMCKFTGELRHVREKGEEYFKAAQYSCKLRKMKYSYLVRKCWLKGYPESDVAYEDRFPGWEWSR